MVTAQSRTLVGQRLGSYRITSVLGEGGMGVVYLGEHVEIGRKAAIKLLRPQLAAAPELIERFFREARAANRIRHPSIVDIYDFVRSDDQGAYMVMEYLEGETLADLLARKGALPPPLAAKIIERVASPLSVAHAEGVVHRDLKPDNIYVLPDPDHANDFRIKVLDFGVAKLFESAAGDSVQTRAGSLLGTPQYMSPEQCNGAEQVDHRSDVYALGVIAYQLLVGHVPFAGTALGEILVKHQTLAPTPMKTLDPRISAAVDEQVLHAMAKRPEDRFQTVDEFARAFSNAVGSVALAPTLSLEVKVPPTVVQPGPTQPPLARTLPPTTANVEPLTAGGSVSKGRSLPVIVGAVTLLAVVAVVAIVMLRRPQTSTADRKAPPTAPQARGTARTASAPAPPAKPAHVPAPSAASTHRGHARAGGAMVTVPAGAFPRGSADDAANERPPRLVSLSAFRIDVDEVTVKRYRACVKAGKCSDAHLGGTELPGQVPFHRSKACNYDKPGRELYPLNCVTWQQAATFCRWAGGSLPTEAQWEKAARGTDGRRYPWGNKQPSCDLALFKKGRGGCGEGHTAPVGSRSPAGDSPYGVRDSAGNVAEWTADWYSSDYAFSLGSNPSGPKRGKKRVVRGGSWIDDASSLRVTRRIGMPPQYRLEDVGFRCARAGGDAP